MAVKPEDMTTPEGEALVLKYVQIGVAETISPELLKTFDSVVKASEFAGNMLTVGVKGYILSKDVHKDGWTEKESVPTSWFQHLKKSLGRKHETREIVTTHSITYSKMCPHIKHKFEPNTGRDVHFNFLKDQ